MAEALNKIKKFFSYYAYYLFIFIAYVLIRKSNILDVDDLIFTYPFLSFDSFQWITDGLFFQNSSLETAHRNPALPLLIQGLKQMSIVSFFPFLMGILLFVFYFYLYRLLLLFFDKPYAAFSTLVFFCIFRIHNAFDYVLADQWSLTLQLIGIFYLLNLEKDFRKIYPAAIFLALSFNFQFTVAFLGPALLYFLYRVLNQETLLKNKHHLLACGLLFIVLVSPQFVYKWVYFGTPLYSKVTHFPLVKLHFYGLFFYGFNFLAFLGIPVAILVLVGFFKSLNTNDKNWHLIHLAVFCYFLFWILLYTWLDVRFLLYFVPFYALYFCKSVESLNLLSFFNFKKYSFVVGLFAYGVLAFSLTLSLTPVDAYQREILPLTPQNRIKLGIDPLSRVNVSITLKGISLETSTKPIDLSNYFSYYKHHNRIDRSRGKALKSDLVGIEKYVLTGVQPEEKIEVCGKELETFYFRMQALSVLKRNVIGCRGKSRTMILANSQVSGHNLHNYELRFTGKLMKYYVLTKKHNSH